MSAGFRERSRSALADSDLQEALGAAAGRFVEKREEAWAALPDPEGLRRRAAWARRRGIARLPELWRGFAERAGETGAELFWAGSAGEAREIVLELCEQAGPGPVVKSKSMLTEEIELNRALEGAGREVVESDLGELIVQWAGEAPSHIIAPAVHKSRRQVRELFGARMGSDPGDDIPALTGAARRHLREVFGVAAVGISGANLAVAETGSIVLVTNEGNGRMVATLPPMHVVVVGAEKIVASWEDAGAVLELLARSGTGQAATSYVQWLTGPRRPGEADGPDRLCVVVVDAGRSRAAGGPYRDVLACIRCGSCLNVCPVYTTTGGHVYASPYPGPIGAVLTPLLRAAPGDWELPQASTLCGACLDACPVMIDLPQMLVDLRADAPRGRAARVAGRLGARLASPRWWGTAFRVARVLQLLGRRIPPVRRWSAGREVPSLARRSWRGRS